MEIGYAVMFITWINVMNLLQLKVIEEKLDNIRIERVIQEDTRKYNIDVIPRMSDINVYHR